MVVNLQSGHEIALQYNQREITPKISKAELWFLSMTHRLIALYNCMKFHFYSFNGCQLTERTRNCIANDQREITPNQRTNGPVNAHLISWPSKAQNIQNMENIW